MFGSAEAFPPGAVVQRGDGRPFPNGNKWAIVRPKEKTLPSGMPAVWLEGLQWITPVELVRVADRKIAEAAVQASRPAETPSEEQERFRYLKENLDAANKRLKPLQHKAAKANAMVDEWKARAFKAERALAGESWRRQLRTVREHQGEIAIAKLDLIAGLIADVALPPEILG